MQGKAIKITSSLPQSGAFEMCWTPTHISLDLRNSRLWELYPIGSGHNSIYIEGSQLGLKQQTKLYNEKERSFRGKLIMVQKGRFDAFLVGRITLKKV